MYILLVLSIFSKHIIYVLYQFVVLLNEIIFYVSSEMMQFIKWPSLVSRSSATLTWYVRPLAAPMVSKHDSET